jgi:hypothetical protein
MATPDTTNGQTAAAAHARASEAGQKAAATRKRNVAKKAATTVRGDAKRAATDARSTGTSLKADAKRAATDTRTAADAARAATEAEAKVRATQVRHLAERTVDVPVGVGLVARDSVVSTVRGLATTLSDRTHLERELSRYERRGERARIQLETQVRQTRSDLEREARERGSRVSRIVSDAQRRLTSLAA